MLIKNEIENQIKALREKIEYHNNRYYNQDNPEISDYEYDKLMLELKNLEKEYPEFAIENSPTKKVGGKTKSVLKKVKHDVPIISLQDVFSEEEVVNFINKTSSLTRKIKYGVEYKIDGLTLVLRYIKGKLTDAITRGDGDIGESVYDNSLEMDCIPKTLKTDIPYLEVRGEVYIDNETFNKINKQQELLGEKTYENARNLAAGTLRQLDSQIAKERNLSIFVFNLEIAEGMSFNSHIESLNWLREIGFTTIPAPIECETADEVINAIKLIGENRWNLNYGIDGAVVKIDDLGYRKELGLTSKVPRWAVAYKYPPEQKESIIEDIFIQVGRTGRMTPVAILSPVRLAGTTVTKATLHNQDYIKQKDIRIGDTVVVQKAGDIIPEIVKVNLDKRNNSSIEYKFPELCPICNTPVIKLTGQADTLCPSEDCPAKISRKFEYFASKDAMNIEGFGPSTVDALIEAGYINNLQDIYTLSNKKEELIKANIIGKEKSVENLINAIEKSKNNDLSLLISGLGIKGIGKSTAKALARYFKDINSLIAATYEEILNVSDIGNISAKDIVKFFNNENNVQIINDLKLYGVNTKLKEENIVDNRFEGMTFVLTGTLPTMTRDDAVKIIESFGGKVSNSVSKKTTYLLAGEDAGSKLEKANTLGVEIIDEDAFKEKIK